MRIFVAFASAAVLAFVAAFPLSASAEDGPQRTISVVGTGSVAASPDMAEVTAGVLTQADTASAALAANTAAVKKLFDVLKAAKVAERDMQTRGFSVSPMMERRDRNISPPRIVGYQVSNQVAVRVRDLDSLGKLLDSLISAGANRVNGIRFTFSNPRELADWSRSRAVEDAKRKAELYAKTAGIRVGRVLTISEQSVSVPRPRFFAAAEARAVTPDVPVARGEQEISARISVVFEIQ